MLNQVLSISRQGRILYNQGTMFRLITSTECGCKLLGENQRQSKRGCLSESGCDVLLSCSVVQFSALASQSLGESVERGRLMKKSKVTH